MSTYILEQRWSWHPVQLEQPYQNPARQMALHMLTLDTLQVLQGNEGSELQEPLLQLLPQRKREA